MKKRNSVTQEIANGAAKEYSAEEIRTAAALGRLLFPGAILSAGIKASMEKSGGKPVDGFAHEMNSAWRFAVIAVHNGRRWEAFNSPNERAPRPGPRTIKVTIVQGLYQAPLRLARRDGSLRFVPAKRRVRVALKQTVTVFNHWCPVLSIRAAGGVEVQNAIMSAIALIPNDRKAAPWRGTSESDRPKPSSFTVRGKGGFRGRYVRSHQLRGLRKWLAAFVPTAIGKTPAPGFIVFVPAVFYGLAEEGVVQRALESGLLHRLDRVRRIGTDGEIRSPRAKGTAEAQL